MLHHYTNIVGCHIGFDIAYFLLYVNHSIDCYIVSFILYDGALYNNRCKGNNNSRYYKTNRWFFLLFCDNYCLTRAGRMTKPQYFLFPLSLWAGYRPKTSATGLNTIFPSTTFNPDASAGSSSQAFFHPLSANATA